MKIIDLKDRFARGLVAGFIATLILAALNLFSFYVLEFTDKRLYNFAAAFIFGRTAETLGEHLFSQLVQIGFGTGMGLIFAYFIIGLRSPNYILKGWLWGLTVEFASFAIVVIAGMTDVLPLTLNTAISSAINASIWGIVLARGLYILDERYDVETEKVEKTKKPEEIKQQVIVNRYVFAPAPARKLQPTVKEGWLNKTIKLFRHK